MPRWNGKFTPLIRIVFNDYEPILAAPTALTSMIPGWSTCKFYDINTVNYWVSKGRISYVAEHSLILCS